MTENNFKLNELKLIIFLINLYVSNTKYSY